MTRSTHTHLAISIVNMCVQLHPSRGKGALAWKLQLPTQSPLQRRSSHFTRRFLWLNLFSHNYDIWWCYVCKSHGCMSPYQLQISFSIVDQFWHIDRWIDISIDSMDLILICNISHCINHVMQYVLSNSAQACAQVPVREDPQPADAAAGKTFQAEW